MREALLRESVARARGRGGGGGGSVPSWRRRRGRSVRRRVRSWPSPDRTPRAAGGAEERGRQKDDALQAMAQRLVAGTATESHMHDMGYWAGGASAPSLRRRRTPSATPRSRRKVARCCSSGPRGARNEAVPRRVGNEIARPKDAGTPRGATATVMRTRRLGTGGTGGTMLPPI